MQKKLHINYVYNLYTTNVYNLNICIHLCYPHHNQSNQYSHHLQKFPYVPLFLLMGVGG